MAKMLELKNCSVVVVDVQGKLSQLMHEKSRLFANIEILIKAAKLLSIPVLWTQQCPDSLGQTIPQITELLTDNKPIDKASFSCCGNEKFDSNLKNLNRKQVILCGIESHICIYQTSVELVEAGYDVTVIADAVSSRTTQNKAIALNKMRVKGVDISSTETVLFELLKTADHPKFKQIAKLIK